MTPTNAIQDDAAATKCPLCEGTVPAGATKCLICGSIIETPKGARKPKAKASGPYRQESLGNALLAVAALGSVFLLGFVLRLSVLSGPMPWLLLTVAAVAVLSAAIAATEASKLKMGNPEGTVPGVWFALVLFAWPYGFPKYFAARAGAGLKDRIRPAIALAALFTACVLFVGWSIRSRGTAAQAGAEAAERQRLEQQFLQPVPPAQ
jgi:hypothetical protein